jgi:hypothetical protein
LGLVLAGGGSLGAWQAGAIQELERSGMAFHAVFGFSAGSCNGAAYALGATHLAVEGWAKLAKLLRLRPRLSPPSLFSDAELWRQLEYAHDDARARTMLRCRLAVPSTRWQRDRRVVAEFDPRSGRWDGPLALHVKASCAIPLVFPPVTLEHGGERHVLLDGGVPVRGERFSFEPLGDCRDVLVLEMVRPEEMGRKHWHPLRQFDQHGRETCRGHMDDGADAWRRAHPGSRVYRLHPSRPLWPMLDFSPEKAREAAALGARDARAFLERPVATA